MSTVLTKPVAATEPGEPLYTEVAAYAETETVAPLAAPENTVHVADLLLPSAV